MDDQPPTPEPVLPNPSGLVAPGVERTADGDPDPPPAPALRIRRAGSLAELAGEFFFFHHALLWGVAELRNDPVQDFRRETPGFEYWQLKLPERVFDGTPDDDSVWACPIEFKDRLVAFLANVAAYSPTDKALVLTAIQDLPVADVLAAARGGAAGTVGCYGVAVLASTITVVYNPTRRARPLAPIPTDVRPPRPDVVARLAELFGPPKDG